MNLDLVLNLFAQSENTLQITDIVTIPGLIWFFGVAVWFFAAMGRRQGKAQRWKWFLAYGLVIFATYAALMGVGTPEGRDQGFYYFMTDVASRSQYDLKRLVIAIWASFLIPLLTLPAMWFFDRKESRAMKDLVS